MKTAIRAILRLCFTDYRVNWIYASHGAAPEIWSDTEDICAINNRIRAALAASSTAKVRNSLSYAHAGLTGYVLLAGGLPLCVAHFATPSQYDRAGTWPLRAGEVALMDIATEQTVRGRGLAVRLIAMTTRLLVQQGTRRVIAFIWWSNTPSVRAFTKAGWQRIGLSIEWKCAGRWWHIHLPFPSAR